MSCKLSELKKVIDLALSEGVSEDTEVHFQSNENDLQHPITRIFIEKHISVNVSRNSEGEIKEDFRVILYQG